MLLPLKSWGAGVQGCQGPGLEMEGMEILTTFGSQNTRWGSYTPRSYHLFWALTL